MKRATTADKRSRRQRLMPRVNRPSAIAELLEERTLLAAVLDADDNTQVDVFTDGILIARHIVGFTGSQLTDGAVGNGANRTDAADITDFLTQNQSSLDVDDNGTVDVFTDGILVARYMVGFTGTALTNAAVADDAQRTDPVAITAWLDDLIPRVSTFSVTIDGDTDRTSNGNLTLTGQVVEATSGVESLLAQVDLGDAVPVIVDAAGAFTFSTSLPSDGTADGGPLIRFRATDNAGNISPLVTVQWQLDTQAPSIVSTANGLLRANISTLELDFGEPVQAAAFDPASYSLIATTGPNSGQPISITGIEQDVNVARFTLANALPNESYRLTVAANVADLAGNAATPQVFDFTIEQPTRLAESSPSNGEEMVSLTRETVIRFDGRVDPTTITPDSFYLIANGERLSGRIRVSSTERFATFFYDTPLPASTEVRIMVNGDQITGRDGLSVDADNDGEPGGTLHADFRTLPLTFIPGTQVFGFVYDSYNRNTDGSDIPIEGVTISLDANPNVFAVTDENGFFELGLQDLNNDGVADGLPAPEFFVHIDGSTAVNAPAGTAFATLGKPFHSVPGQRVQLEMNRQPFDIYLPPMAAGDIVQLDPNADTEVGFGPAAQVQIRAMFADDPGKAQIIIDTMRVTYPAGSAQDNNDNVSTQATIIPVAPERLPTPLPIGTDPSLVVCNHSAIRGLGLARMAGLI